MKRWEVQCTINRGYRPYKSRWIARKPKVTSVMVEAETEKEAIKLAVGQIKSRLTEPEFVVNHLTRIREMTA